MSSNVRRALVSVSNKTGLAEFARELVSLGFEIISTGGTSRFLQENGVAVIDISTYTGFPEIMDGRVKTLHPKVHGAILGRPDLPEDAVAITAHGIVPFELIVCNLYPFAETISRTDVTIPEAIEQIDIGGPSMIRSAAKNHAYVGVVTHPDQYAEVTHALKSGSLSLELRRRLSAAAFALTAQYDATIAKYMREEVAPPVAGESMFPARLTIGLERQYPLRYGENPHQSAAFYVESPIVQGSIASAKALHGKELSYNNLLDADAAWGLVQEFPGPAASVIKHNNPCGAGTADNLAEAFIRAYSGDQVSAFGSIIGFNRPVDVATAEELCQPDRFVEAIIAPAFEPAAFEILTTKPKWKANVRLLECPLPPDAGNIGWDYRRVTGGLLVQERDMLAPDEAAWKVVTRREPSPEEWHDLRFAWTIIKHIKSNAILFAKDGALVGVGAGQMSRLDSVHMAAHKAQDRSRGAVLGSDAFFPFRDGVDEAAKAGVAAIIQPGGSRRDEEVIAACDEHAIAMIFTGRRHFRH